MENGEIGPVLDPENKELPARYYHGPALISARTIPLEDPQENNFIEYWRVLVKHRWAMLACMLTILTIVAIGTWNATPIYRAKIKIQIDPELTNILPFKDTNEDGRNYAQSQEYLLTQFDILKSESLAERVIHKLNLTNDSRFLPEKRDSSISGRLAVVFHLKDEGSEDREEMLVRSFGENLSLDPVRNSRVVAVNFDAVDPYLAAEIANAIACEYIQMNFEAKYKATISASEFLDKQMMALKAKVEKSEEDLVGFSQEHDIYAISDKDNVILQKLADLNSALTSAQAERIQKESLWKTVERSWPKKFPSALGTPIIKELETNLAAVKLQHAKLSARFKPGWPELDQLTEQVAEAEKMLAAERQRVIDNVETEYQAAIQRERLLTEALNTQKLEISLFNQNSIQYNILKRQIETDKQIYEGVLQRVKEAGVSAGLKSNNISVVDPAKPPRTPYKPRKFLNLSLAFALGLFFSVGLAFFIEHLDSSINSPEDIERFTKLSFLGAIPSIASYQVVLRRTLPVAQGNGLSLRMNSKAIEMIAHYDPQSLISEMFRNLRTSILLSSGTSRPPRIIMVTSSQMSEGKTTTAINIAITLAQAGKSVILMDCDMRKPRLHRIFGLDNKNGMSTYLSANCELTSVIQTTEVPGLFAITSGHIPPNPAELIGSPRMEQGLSSLAEDFDYVVIDTPPILSVTDSRIIAAMVDGVLLVIKSGETPREAVRRATRSLEDINAHIIGTLLNNLNLRSAENYYYSKYSYYGYGTRHNPVSGKKG
jgi:polysaccharide biosynthesis transport protein